MRSCNGNPLPFQLRKVLLLRQVEGSEGAHVKIVVGTIPGTSILRLRESLGHFYWATCPRWTASYASNYLYVWEPRVQRPNNFWFHANHVTQDAVSNAFRVTHVIHSGRKQKAFIFKLFGISFVMGRLRPLVDSAFFTWPNPRAQSYIEWGRPNNTTLLLLVIVFFSNDN